MLQNAYFVAKIGADTAENERTFADILTKFRDVMASTSGGAHTPVHASTKAEEASAGVRD